MKKKIRLFFTSDIHGSDICFRKFISAAKFYKADVLILGGDITGKFIVPIIREEDAYSATFLGEKIRVHTESELNDLIKKIRNTGAYVYVFDKDEYREYCENPDMQRRLFEEVIRESLREWISYADEKLKEMKGVEVYVMLGNDDEHFVSEEIAKI